MISIGRYREHFGLCFDLFCAQNIGGGTMATSIAEKKEFAILAEPD